MFTTRHILPSVATVEAFNRGLLETEKVLLGSPASTLSRLFEEVGRVVADERRPISPVGRKLLLEQLVRERYCEGHGYFARHWEFPGFIGTLDRFIGELKQACLTPAAFAAVAAAETAGGRLRELAELFALYDRELAARGLMDDHDREQAAITHLRGGAPLPESLVGVDTLLVRGIYDFTPLQLALLVALSRRLRVVLRLPYGPGREQLYAYVERTADTIEALDNNELQLETEFVEPQGPLLTPLLRALFDRQEPSVPPGALSLVAAPGAYRECEEIGRRIRALLETGVSPASIAVLFRDTETYGAMMEDVCRRFRIRVSYRRGSPLFASPLARVCLAPFTVVAARFSREALLELWKSTYVDLASHGVHGDEVEQTLLDLRYQDESLGTVEQVLERRIARLKRYGKPHDREERVLRRLGPLLAELRRFRGSRTAREFVTLLEKFIAAHRIYPRGIQAADLRVLKRDASAITGLQQLLRDLERDLAVIGLDQARFSPAEFASLLRQGMDGRFLAGEKGAGVAIMNFHDARGLSFPHVFVGGLNEGICPAVPTPHPLFKEEEKLRCNRLRGARLFRAEGEKSREEPLLFYLAVGCAEHSLTLSYAYADSRGNVLLRSPFLEELLDAVPLAEERVPLNRITPELDRCLEREELLNTLALQGHLRLPLEDAEGLAPVLA
ncbi:MAG TPA: 3'-5' exonuclease, partial [Geobacteraceae bacterium]